MSYEEDRNNAYLVASLVGYALSLKAEQILQNGRGTRALVNARQVAMYLAHTGLGMSLSKVAIGFDRDRSTIAYACSRVETKRDAPEFDAWIDELEQSLVAVAPLTVKAA